MQQADPNLLRRIQEAVSRRFPTARVLYDSELSYCHPSGRTLHICMLPSSGLASASTLAHTILELEYPESELLIFTHSVKASLANFGEAPFEEGREFCESGSGQWFSSEGSNEDSSAPAAKDLSNQDSLSLGELWCIEGHAEHSIWALPDDPGAKHELGGTSERVERAA